MLSLSRVEERAFASPFRVPAITPASILRNPCLTPTKATAWPTLVGRGVQVAWAMVWAAMLRSARTAQTGATLWVLTMTVVAWTAWDTGRSRYE